MIRHAQIRLTARAHAATVVVCSTGVVTLAASAVGGGDPAYPSYTRADGGSFLTDGFAPGLELLPAGFASNVRAVVRKVTATVCAVERAAGDGVLGTETSAGGRSLTVGLPSRRAFRNLGFTPLTGFPYWAELYTPGPRVRITVGPNGLNEARPLYSMNVYVPQDSEELAADRYVDALLEHFKTGTVLTLPSGDVVRVRGEPGPSAAPLQNDIPGWAIAPITVPLMLVN